MDTEKLKTREEKLTDRETYANKSRGKGEQKQKDNLKKIKRNKEKIKTKEGGRRCLVFFASAWGLEIPRFKSRCRLLNFFFSIFSPTVSAHGTGLASE